MIYKSIIIIASFLFLYQTQKPSYTVINKDKQWEEVENLTKSGNYEDAQDIINELYEFYIGTTDYQHMYKALLYKMKLDMVNQEDATLNQIIKLNQIIAETTDDVKRSIVQHTLARYYATFSIENGYQIRERTFTKNLGYEQFLEWSLPQFRTEIISLLHQSTDHKKVLQNLNIEEWDIAIDRPTNQSLLDLLLLHSLEVLNRLDNSNQFTNRSNFYFDNDALIKNNTNFVTYEPICDDSDNLKYNLVLFYQKQAQEFLSQNDNKAIVFGTITRLDYFNSKAIQKNAKETYFNTMTALLDAFKKLDNGSFALLFAQKVSQNINADNDYKYFDYDNQKLISFCEGQLIETKVDELKKGYQSLINSIQNPLISARTKTQYLPNQVNEIEVTSKNLSSVDYRLYSIDKDTYTEIVSDYNISNEERKQKIKSYVFSRALHQNGNWTLENNGDLNQVNDFKSIPALSPGFYSIVIGNDINKDNTELMLQAFQVTAIGIEELKKDKFTEFRLIDKTNGYSLENAQVKIYKLVRHSNRKHDQRFIREVTTDSNGKFKFTNTERTQYLFEVNRNDDRLEVVLYAPYQPHDEHSIRTNQYCTILTDRSIYRPGQTVHFKAILSENQKQQMKVVPNHSLQVSFYDVNRTEIAKQTLQTNEFGSVNGSFEIPLNVLTGQFRIETNASSSGRKMIRVEEYKRPKFSVSIDSIANEYSLEEEIAISGKAMTFNQVPIQNAKGTYTVTRKINYRPWPWIWWCSPRYSNFNESIVMEKGEVTTKDDGSFAFDFNAVPNYELDPKLLPIFHYEIDVDITDSNGETRSVKETINAGYHQYVIRPKIQSNFKVQDELKIRADVTNLNGVSQNKEVLVSIYQIQEPKKAPLFYSIPKIGQDFNESIFRDKNRFGDDSVLGKSVYDYPKELIHEITIRSNEEVTIKELKGWDSGKYIVSCKVKDDVSQQPFTTKTLFDVYNWKNKTAQHYDWFYIDETTKSINPKESISYLIGSDRDIVVRMVVLQNDDIIKDELIALNDNQRTVTIPTTASEGRIVTYFRSVYQDQRNNREFTTIITTPESGFKIEVISFKNKLEPGNKETWKVTIVPNDERSKEDLNVELLTSMYDASLEEFIQHKYDVNVPHFGSYKRLYFNTPNEQFNPWYIDDLNQHIGLSIYQYRLPSLKFFDFGYMNLSGGRHYSQMAEMEMGTMQRGRTFAKSAAPMAMENSANMSMDEVAEDSADQNVTNNSKVPDEDKAAISFIRTNLQETAFFIPQLQTDKNGNIVFEFESPEALTVWKWWGVGHNKQMQTSSFSEDIVTQKDLMVFPNPPRFLRKDDIIEFPVKIANISDRDIEGTVSLQLKNSLTGQDVTNDFEIPNATQTIVIKSNGSNSYTWKMKVPNDIEALEYSVIAKSGNQGDGEISVLPILENQMLVTETMPFAIRGKGEHKFSFENLDKMKQSNTLNSKALTIEYTSNPIWLVIQSIPHIETTIKNCNEQLMTQFYTNKIALDILEKNPKIEKVFALWKSTGAEEFQSALSKNQELKSVVLNESPWINEALSETERMHQLSELFNTAFAATKVNHVWKKLSQNQNSDGGWGWLANMRSSRYITAYIVNQFARLQHLGITTTPFGQNNIEKALAYLDHEFIEEYRRSIVRKESTISLSSYQLQHLYIRSLLTDYPSKEKDYTKIAAEYIQVGIKDWTNMSLFNKATLAVVLEFNDETSTAKQIVESLRQSTVKSEELGMYFKALRGNKGYTWNEWPIGVHARVIEAFEEVTPNDKASIQELLVWLIKQKEVQSWNSNIATSDAIYAILRTNSAALISIHSTSLTVGDESFTISNESDTQSINFNPLGYLKESWNDNDITIDKQFITVTTESDNVQFGGIYWQYTEQLEKITHAETSLNIEKKMFLLEDEELKPMNNPKVGDLVRVRIVLETDRDMEFIHVKDMRAAGLEPLEVLSGVQWQDALYYYQSTKDVATHFFFDRLPKGKYVLEYDTRVFHKGEFANGISSIQSMYAPYFSGHTSGTRIIVGE